MDTWDRSALSAVIPFGSVKFARHPGFTRPCLRPDCHRPNRWNQWPATAAWLPSRIWGDSLTVSHIRKPRSLPSIDLRSHYHLIPLNEIHDCAARGPPLRQISPGTLDLFSWQLSNTCSRRYCLETPLLKTGAKSTKNGNPAARNIPIGTLPNARCPYFPYPKSSHFAL